MNPMDAIRAKCLDCCCGSAAEVRQCHLSACALHPFRMGTNPFRKKRELSEEARAALAARLAARREKSPVLQEG